LSFYQIQWVRALKTVRVEFRLSLHFTTYAHRVGVCVETQEDRIFLKGAKRTVVKGERVRLDGRNGVNRRKNMVHARWRKLDKKTCPLSKEKKSDP